MNKYFKNSIKSFIGIILLLFISTNIIVINNSKISRNFVSSNNLEDSTEYTWLIMMYLDGDNNLERYALEIMNDLESGIIGANNIKIIALVDRHPAYNSRDGNWDNTRLYEIIGDSTRKITSIHLQNWDERNMGNSSTLEEFLIFCLSNYPAEHYLLNLFNHGGGVIGACEDWSSNKDLLSVDEMQQAIKYALNSVSMDKLDILVFSACEMALIEVAYEFRNCFDYFLASQATSYNEGFNWDDIIKIIAGQKPTPRNLTEIIVNSYKSKWERKRSATTFSAIDLTKISNTTIFEEFAQYIRIAITESGYISDIITARKDTQQFYDPFSDERTINQYSYNLYPGLLYIDLIHFIEEILENTNITQSYPELQFACDELLEQLKEVIIANYQHQSFEGNANGLSIFFPYNHFNVYDLFIYDYCNEDSNDYQIENIDWLKETNWRFFMYIFYYNDRDTDLLNDWYEVEYNLDEFNNDTDNDQIRDDENDFDQDGLNNYLEFVYKTDPMKIDTDYDSLSDYEEKFVYQTNPIFVDTDFDGYADNVELKFGKNPLDENEHPRITMLNGLICFGDIVILAVIVIRINKKNGIIE